MSLPRGNSARTETSFSLEANKPHPRPVTDQDIAIRALERRTGNHAVSTSTPCSIDPCSNPFQPWPAIVIRQRVAVMHLFDVRGRMEPIGIFIDPTQAKGQQRGYWPLPCFRAPHNHDNTQLFSFHSIPHHNTPS